jgi:predicted nucleic acid-binding protein
MIVVSNTSPINYLILIGYIDLLPQLFQQIIIIIKSPKGNLNLQPNRKTLINQMRGLLKTDQPPPTDAQVEAILEEHRVEKYLK